MSVLKTDMFIIFNYSDMKTDMFFFVYKQVSSLRRNEFFKINASVLANVNIKNVYILMTYLFATPTQH